MIYGESRVKTPIRWGMVGGGRGSSIGYIHRSAALRDRHFQLAAGAFDIDAARGRDFGVNLHVDPARCYDNYRMMFEAEARHPNGIEAVSIATPNSTHYEISKAALEHNLHVYCEKPLCFTSEQAAELVRLAEARRRVFAVSYGYAGYQMIHQGREMVRRGDLGEIRIVQMEFAHGGNTGAAADQAEGQKWRTDPRLSGPSFVLGDVGTHALYLAETMVPDFEIRSLMCAKKAFVPQREPLEDNAYVLMQLAGGGMASVWCSAVNCGSVHGLKIRIIGSKASLSWWAEHPNQLTYEADQAPIRILERGTGYLYPEGTADDRIGAGHGEGIFESWSNLYGRFAEAIRARDEGRDDFLKIFWLPGVRDGASGVRWVERCVASAERGGIWLDY